MITTRNKNVHMSATSIILRKQRVSDAKRFYEILHNPHFEYFTLPPKSLEAEKEFLREGKKNKLHHGYTIIIDDIVVGACGIKIDQRKQYIGEIGYCIDEKYWGRGIATRAVKLLEKVGFTALKLQRIEIKMDPRNGASERVAIKCGYQKEGTTRKSIKRGDEFRDQHLYAKVK